MNRTCKVLGLLAVAVLLMAPAPSLNNPWGSSFETSPPNSDPVSQGDDWLRAHAAEVRQRMEVEHEFGTGLGGVSGDNGLHRVGSARCYVQTTAPTTLEAGDAPNDYDNTGGAGTATLSANESNRSPARTAGHGRCWFDTDGTDATAGTVDDYSYWVYNAGWQQVTAGFASTFNLLGSGRNMLQNSSFEIGASTTVPELWSTANSPTISYSAVDQTEGGGQTVTVDAAGGANGGITQTIPDLKAGRQYLAIARANAQVAGDTCSLRTTGASVNAADTSSDDGTYEDLVSVFTVDGSGTSVVFILEADANGDACAFDKAGVFEIGSGLQHPMSPSSSSWLDTNGNTPTPSGSGDYDAIETQTYRVESHNCYVDLHATSTNFSGTGSSNHRLQAKTNAGAYTTLRTISTTTTTTNGPRFAEFFRVTAGNTYSFKLLSNALGVSTEIVNLDVAMHCPGD